MLKGRVEMSCNDEVFTLEPFDAVIISPQVGHSTLALEEDVIAFSIRVGHEFYQQYDSEFGSYHLLFVPMKALVIINFLQPCATMQL